MYGILSLIPGSFCLFSGENINVKVYKYMHFGASNHAFHLEASEET